MREPLVPVPSRHQATLLALGAIALWASLAPLGVALQSVPPFLLTGLGLLAGSALGLGLCLVQALRARRPWPLCACH